MGKKKKHGGSRKMTLPMAVIVPMAIPLFEIGSIITGATGSGTGTQKANAIGYIMTGYDGIGKNFHMERFLQTYGPIGVGLAVHWVAKISGVNKMLGRAKVPLLRI